MTRANIPTTYVAAVTRTGGTLSHLMGFNPFRKQSNSALDIFLVVGFIALTLAFIAWGFLG